MTKLCYVLDDLKVVKSPIISSVGLGEIMSCNAMKPLTIVLIHKPRVETNIPSGRLDLIFMNTSI
jgi:hypothetical protein